MIQIFLCLIRIGILKAKVTGAEGSCHLCFNTAVVAGEVWPFCFALHQFIFCHIHLRSAPPYVVEAAVADHIDNFVAQVTLDQIIQNKLEVVAVLCEFAAILYAVRILEQPPTQHGCRVGIGEGKFQVVAGIIPAAGYIVIGHAVGTPGDFIPIREHAGLLYLIEEHRFLQCFAIVIGRVGTCSC